MLACDWGDVGGEQVEDLVAEVRVLLDAGADGGVLLVDDRVATAVDEDVGRDEASERNDVFGDFHSVSHREGVGVAGDRNQVLGLEVGGLGQNAAANLGQGEAVGGTVVVDEATNLLGKGSTSAELFNHQ